MNQAVRPTDLIGRDVYGRDHEKIGSVGQVYLADNTRQAEWATVRTGMFGMKESFVPLRGARWTDRGGLEVPVDKEQVKDAPRVDADGRLSEAEAAELYRHYLLGPQAMPDDRGTAGGRTARGKAKAGRHADASADAGGRGSPEEIIRSEERMKVGTEQVETGTFRVRKYLVTEDQDVTVPLTREEVRVEREPIADGEATGREPKLGEADYEVTLHAERPVVDTETVPVERVRLDTETVTDQETVHGKVRKEKLDIDDGRAKPKNR